MATNISLTVTVALADDADPGVIADLRRNLIGALDKAASKEILANPDCFEAFESVTVTNEGLVVA